MHVVVFDLSPTATGAYYVAGELVWHASRVCQVQSTSKIAGTRFRATLHVVPHPTVEQRRAALEWRSRFGSLG